MAARKAIKARKAGEGRFVIFMTSEEKEGREEDIKE
jgi:hypothetical protein